MRSKKSALLFGFLIWLIPFIAALIIYPIRDDNRPLFESIMPVVVTGSVVLFSILYFKKMDKNFAKEGVKLGLIWLGICIIIDLPLFSAGPMEMPLVEYMSDIGLTYLIIPAVTIGFGLSLEKRA